MIETAAPGTLLVTPRSTGGLRTGLWGRGLFASETIHGKRRLFTEQTWRQYCQQARANGMSAVHLKIADGTNLFYSREQLLMLRDIAREEGIRCFPIHYVYGNGFGQLTKEINLVALSGLAFGGVCLYLSPMWTIPEAASWARQYQQQIRPHFQGPVIPMLPANIAEHTFPYRDLFAWCDGWMPLIFQEHCIPCGEQSTVEQLLQWLLAQWNTLALALQKENIAFPHPLPVLECSAFRPEAVSAWLLLLKSHGYCGFWYDETLSHYREIIVAAPEPAWPLVKSPITPTPETADAETTKQPVPDPQRPEEEEEIRFPTFSRVTGIRQNLSSAALALSWSYYDPSIPMDPDHPITKLWTRLMQGAYSIGAALSPRQPHGDGVVQNFEGGRIYLLGNQVWVQLIAQTRLPGNPAGLMRAATRAES